jgi:hypothetical protein
MEFLANEKILISIIAAVSAVLGGILTSVISPYVKIKIEESSKEKERKRALIIEWRRMILEVQSSTEYENQVSQNLQIHPSFLSLEPHLSKEAKNRFHRSSRTITAGSALSTPLLVIKDEISRLEKEWRI